MSKSNKRRKETEYRKVQQELKLLAGQPGGWGKIEQKLKEKNDLLTANDIKSLKQWIKKEKEIRNDQLKTELGTINDFFQQYKDNPKVLRQIGLYKKGLSQNSPMYDSLIDAQMAELEECNIKLDHGFVPVNPSFAWMNDERWQKLMEKITRRKKGALEKQIKDIKESLAEVEAEIEKKKGEKDKRISQIKEELKELGEKFPKDELSYIG